MRGEKEKGGGKEKGGMEREGASKLSTASAYVHISQLYTLGIHLT